MSTEQTRITNSPVDVPLGKLTLKMSALTDRDMAELDEWVRGQYIRNARASVEGDTDDVWRRTMRLAMEIATAMTWMRPPGSRLIATPDGMARLAWQGCHRHMPQLKSYVELRELLFDPKNLELFNELFERVNEVPPAPPSKGDEPRPLAEASSMERSLA